MLTHIVAVVELLGINFHLKMKKELVAMAAMALVMVVIEENFKLWHIWVLKCQKQRGRRSGIVIVRWGY
ncbi:hypothetical protein DXA13_19305 [Clostridium sp. AM58-1XD]|nr:hypothetical protein DXA13_19305 [Clostridium sp. AM58-1XD]